MSGNTATSFAKADLAESYGSKPSGETLGENEVESWGKTFVEALVSTVLNRTMF
jgi:hypothetical protein